MARAVSSFRWSAGLAAVLLSGAVFAAQGQTPEVLPPSTAVPVRFVSTTNAAKAKAGDPIRTRLMQTIHLGSGESIPKGSWVIGHITDARPLRGSETGSDLAIHFDRIVTKSGSIPVTLYVRALADVFNSQDASFPDLPTEMNWEDISTQIGGDKVSPFEHKVFSSYDDPIGVVRKDGVYERLVATDYADRFTHFRCNGTADVQSVSIYSGSACGLYGFDATYLSKTGQDDPDHVIEIGSNRYTIKLYAGTTALLQVAEPTEVAQTGE
jgi:hypothetical protein